MPTAVTGEGLEAPPTLRGTGNGQLEDADLEVSVAPRELQEKDLFPGKKLGSFSEKTKKMEKTTSGSVN